MIWRWHQLQIQSPQNTMNINLFSINVRHNLFYLRYNHTNCRKCCSYLVHQNITNVTCLRSTVGNTSLQAWDLNWTESQPAFIHPLNLDLEASSLKFRKRWDTSGSKHSGLHHYEWMNEWMNECDHSETVTVNCYRGTVQRKCHRMRPDRVEWR